MLYHVITDGESVSYIPTTLGKILLAAIFLILLAAAVFFARRKSAGLKALSNAGTNKAVGTDKAAAAGKTANSNSSDTGSKAGSGRKGSAARLTAKQLAFCAMAIALGTVLSNLKIYEFPFGGSITLLSMLIICLPGYWFGLEAGLITGAAYGVLQLIIDPYVIHPVQLLVDYPPGTGGGDSAAAQPVVCPVGVPGEQGGLTAPVPVPWGDAGAHGPAPGGREHPGTGGDVLPEAGGVRRTGIRTASAVFSRERYIRAKGMIKALKGAKKRL